MKQIYKKENRILLSMITGMIVISLLCGIQWRGSQKNVLAWWGSIYPELFEDIKEGFVEDYIPLPGQYDINEYRIMEEFIYELPAGKNQDVLARTIQGRGAFRRFKDKLYDLNLEKQWYQYREEAYEKIARQWSERHKIDIVE